MYTTAPSASHGPNGISICAELFCFDTNCFIRTIGNIIKHPNTEPPKRANNAPFHPQKEPIHPSKITSPSPIASRFKIHSARRRNQYKNPDANITATIEIPILFKCAKSGSVLVESTSCKDGIDNDTNMPSIVPPIVTISGSVIVSISTNVQKIIMHTNIM